MVGFGHEGTGFVFPSSVLEMNSVAMALRRSESLLMMLLLPILLDFTNDIWTLTAPSRVFMDSVNMKHTLRWIPLQASCNTTVLYSVQYQGEFELLLSRWLDAADCQQIPHTHCDLTFDLGSDSDYSLQVRAQCGTQLSAWTKLSQPFNRRDTVLTVPDMAVTTAGDTLQVSFKELPLTATISVKVWKKDDELQTVVYSMSAEQTVLPIHALQEGVVYCVRAEIILDSGLQSNSTKTHCVPITGPKVAAWKRPTTVTVTVVIVVGLLFALFWSIIHCHPDACQAYFQKETLPQSLKGDWDIQILRRTQEEEPCEVLSIDSEQRASMPNAALTSLLQD